MKNIILILIFILFSCKKEDKNCLESFNRLYEKRYSLWFHFEKNEEYRNVGYDNFSIQKYQKGRKNLNDSLSLIVDCAIKENQNNEILLLYKMKTLFLNDKLKEITIFFNRLEKKKLSENFYFQLSLFNVLATELLDKKMKIKEYENLKKIYFEQKNKNASTEILLDYLINNDKEKFLEKIKNKGFDIEEIQNKNREEMIKNLMIRADNFIFD